MKKRTITLNGAKFILGDKYRDKLLGSEGIATAGAAWLTGCDQLLLSWNDSTGRPVDLWTDVTRIEAVKVKKTPGGPAPSGFRSYPSRKEAMSK